jgi:hypothetical protein
MPIHKNPMEKGRLYIHFHVEFPDSTWNPSPKVINVSVKKIVLLIFSKGITSCITATKALRKCS